MAYNRIITKNGTALFDLSKVTVAPATLALGVTAFNKDGELIVGTSTGVRQGITDVETLPTENIDSTNIYRVLEKIVQPSTIYLSLGGVTQDYETYYEERIENEIGTAAEISIPVHEVAELPETGEAMSFTENPMGIIMPMYYVIPENQIYTYDANDGWFSASSETEPFLGKVSTTADMTEEGIYLLESSSYSYYRYWNYCDNQWVELIEIIETEELPVSNIRRDACYSMMVEDLKVYFIYKKDSWMAYASGGGGAFIDYVSGTSIEELKIPEGVTTIAPYAFYKREYKRIVIPATVTSIKEYAFEGCEKLEEIYYADDENKWNEIVIEKGNEKLSEVNKIYNYVQNTN